MRHAAIGNVIRVGIVMTLASGSSASFGLIQGELSGGNKTVSFDPDSTGENKEYVSGTELTFGVMVDPIPMVPFSLGIQAQSYGFDFGKQIEDSLIKANPGTTYSGSYKLAGLLYGPTVKVWAPLPYVKPYLKFTYLTGSEVLKMDFVNSAGAADSMAVSGSQTATHTGTDLCLGLGYSPIKFVQLYLEYAIHKGKTTLKSQDIEMTLTSGGSATTAKINSDDLTDEDKKAETADSKSIRLGIAVGI